MPDNDFQERLQRIAANTQAQTGSRATNETGLDRVRKMNLGLFIVGCIVMNVGTSTVMHVNKNYVSIRDSSGLGIVVGIVLAGLAVTIVGIILAVRALPKKGSVVQPTAVRQPASGSARAVTSLIGFAFGTVACLSLFMADAARIVNPDTANVFSGFALMSVLVLTLLAILIGITGLFLRGRSLHRVPLYFLAGATLTFAAFRLLRINLLDWPAFIAIVQ